MEKPLTEQEAYGLAIRGLEPAKVTHNVTYGTGETVPFYEVKPGRCEDCEAVLSNPVHVRCAACASVLFGGR